MKYNKDAVILEHIIDYCDDIANTVERFNGTKEMLEADRIFRNACSMPLMQIGELAKKLSEEAVKISNIPWKEIKGMRTFFAHEYQEIDIEIVWNSINDISAFKHDCVQLKHQIQNLSEAKGLDK